VSVIVGCWHTEMEKFAATDKQHINQG